MVLIYFQAYKKIMECLLLLLLLFLTIQLNSEDKNDHNQVNELIDFCFGACKTIKPPVHDC